MIKEHRKQYLKEYYLKNKDKILEQHRRWWKNNPENHRDYYQNNKDKIIERMNQWKRDNPEKIKEMGRKYYQKNRDKIIKQSKQRHKDNPEYFKEYRQNHKEEYNEHIRNKRRIDLKCNVNHKLSSEIYHALKKNKNGWHWEDLVSYTLDDLIKHLQKTIPKGYVWQDYLNGDLHIDHIIPISAFNFTKSEHIDFKRCWDLDNLRLLPKKENLKKSNKLYKPFQPALAINI